jgi:hypothetical protein
MRCATRDGPGRRTGPRVADVSAIGVNWAGLRLLLRPIPEGYREGELSRLSIN